MRKIKFSNIYLSLFLFVIMSTLLCVDVFAEDSNLFCDSDVINNFNDSGFNSESNYFYFLSDNKIYNVYSWYDDINLFYDDVNESFFVDDRYFVIGHSDESGTGFIDGYSTSISKNDYSDFCILKVNNNIPIKNKNDYFLTDSGIKIINNYSDCFDSFDNVVISNVCSLFVVSSETFSSCLNNPFTSILFALFVILSSSVVIYIIWRCFKRV